MSSAIDTIVIGKARKNEGFYICHVTTLDKSPFVVTIDQAQVLTIKETSNTVILKSKCSVRYMDDLNDKIIDVVKQNSSNWFSTSIDNELIDEYYISTLQYDKKRGETIRIKVRNIDEVVDKQLSGHVKFTLVLKYLKFYKQKFFAEFNIEGIEAVELIQPCNDVFLDDDCEDYQEYALPSYEEIQTIRMDCLQKLYNSRNKILEQMEKYQAQSQILDEAIENLEIQTDLNRITELCEEYQMMQVCD
jgi:hypothetical protein